MEYPFNDTDIQAAVTLATARLNTNSTLGEDFAQEVAHAALDIADARHRMSHPQVGDASKTSVGIEIQREGRRMVIRFLGNRLTVVD